MFPVWNRHATFYPKEVVVRLSLADTAKAYRVADLQQVRLVNDALGDINVIVVASPESGLVHQSDPSEVLPHIPSRTSFWFGWFQHHPDTEIYQPVSP